MPNKSIAHFFRSLGYPLHNTRWSWGAYGRNGVLLRTWADETTLDGSCVRVLFAPEHYVESHSLGFRERVDHLRKLWSGGLAGYVVMAAAADEGASPRTIASYDDEAVQAISTLFEDKDGAIWAELGERVPVDRLELHSLRYRLRPASAPIPTLTYGSSAHGNVSSAGYVTKLPAMRQWLIEVAKRRSIVTYSEARTPFGMRTFEHRHAMDRIGHECISLGEPILTSLIVNPDTGRCSNGFLKEFGRDDALERLGCYAFWAEDSLVAKSGQIPPRPAVDQGELRELARKFAQTEMRPQQRAFRGRVFWACGGACVVTGCRIVEVLDAAHRKGRDWRLGHNLAEDGLLLRKDIHSMYDAGLIEIKEDGQVTFDPKVADHYWQYVKELTG